MRRFTLVALAAFVFAPAAHAACGLTASALSGASPLRVTYTARCASSVSTWDFGDGTTATGQTVSHTFAAGVYRPALTSGAGVDTSSPVLSIALRVTKLVISPRGVPVVGGRVAPRRSRWARR